MGFYSFFSITPRGRHTIRVCLGTACYVRGGKRVLEFQRTGIALPARVFFGLGENDTPSMTGDLEMLEAQLDARSFQQLEVISRRLAGRDHYNVLPEAFREGLRRRFA